jgi:hypothetical protein
MNTIFWGRSMTPHSMKGVLPKAGSVSILGILILIASMAFGQTTLQTVNFETSGSGYTVTGVPNPTSPDDWWERTDGTTVNPTAAFTGKQGTYFFYGEDTDNGRTADDPVYVTLSSVSVSGYTNLQVKILVAAKNDVGSSLEKEEYLKIQYAFDGGSFSTRAQFITPNVNDTYYAEDTNADGTTDGASLSPAFAEFTYSIPSSGTNLQIRIAANIDQGNEEIGFDNIRIQGTEEAIVTFTNGANAALNFTQTSPLPLPYNNWLMGQFSLTGTATGATLNSVTVTLGGTYDGSDLQSTPFQLYANSSNSFIGSSALGSSVADPGSGSNVTFSSLSDAIPSGTRYYWVTADISATATADDNMNGTIDAAGDLSITGGTLGASNYGKLNAGTDGSLPVELVSFSARSEGHSIVLNWTTESETDNLGFILERSEENVWAQIASYQTHDELKGQGNTSTRTEYSFTDKTVESGKGYSYRLSDVSTKGEITVYAPLVITMNNLPEKTEMENAYPNPFNPQTYISYQLSEDSRVEISVFDLLGRQVKSLYTGRQLAGSYQVYWNATDEKGIGVPSGAYLIRMQTNTITQVQKVLLMK